MTPLSVPFVGLDKRFLSNENALLDAVRRTGAAGHFILGDAVAEFEQKLADFCHSRYVISVNSGFDALFLSLKALGIGPGDEVITAVNSFIATAGAIAATGATPVFVDVAADMNIDTSLIEKTITPHTRAIIPVHLTGLPAQMDSIVKIAETHGLYLVEDAAQAIGATLSGKTVGTWGDFGCFSLHPLKNFHVFGDGGFICTQNEQLKEQILLLRNHGLENRDDCLVWGYNSRLDGIQAAMGLETIDLLPAWNERVREIAAQYREGLLAPVIHQPISETARSVFHNYVIRTPARDELIAHMKHQGIDTKIHYPVPLHLQPAARSLGYRKGDFPVAEAHAGDMMSLPIYPEMDNEQVAWVINVINEYFSAI